MIYIRFCGHKAGLVTNKICHTTKKTNAKELHMQVALEVS